MTRVFSASLTPSVPIVFQLRKYLKQHHPGKLQRGITERIHEKTGLNRATIHRLMKNKVKNFKWETLEKIVGFLASECHKCPQDVLRDLFGVKPSAFWKMFANSSGGYFKVQICQGVRNDPVTSEPTSLNLFDNTLYNVFHHMLAASDTAPRPDVEQCMLRSYAGPQTETAIFAEAREFYEQFRNGAGSRALVCVGSMKSLPLSEIVVCDVLDTRPHVPRTTAHPLRERAIPFFFKYREIDPHPPSAFGGRDLPWSAVNGHAGVAYEVDSDHWEFCPVTEKEDAAVVFYVYHPAEETAQLVMAGFSGRATLCLARDLPALANDLWPPSYCRPHLMVGAFVIRYEFASPPANSSETSLTRLPPARSKLIPIAAEVLARRLEGVALNPAAGVDIDLPADPGPPRPPRPR